MTRTTRWLLILAMLLLPTLAVSQTTVNITVIDTPDSQTWNNGTYAVQLVGQSSPSAPSNPNGTFTLTGGGGSIANQFGSLTATGTASISLPANANIAPLSQWRVTVCPQASSGCFTQLVTVSTSSPQTLTMTPPSPRINIQTTPPPILAYTTAELTGATIGSEAFLIGTGQQVCQAAANNLCTTWGGTSGGSFSAGTVIDATAYNVAPGNAWFDATWTNGSNTVSIGASDAPFTSAMNGWLCGGTTGTAIGLPSDFNSVLVKVLGTFTFVSATSGTCSGTAANASASGTNNGILVMGPDDTTALNNAWQAATGGPGGNGQSQCKSLQLPGGVLMTKTGQFNTINCNNAMTGNLSAGVWVYGWGRTVTRIVPALDQFNYTGVTFDGKNCLFFCHNGINVNQLGIFGAGYENTGAQTAVMAACTGDSQYQQFEINDWGAGNGGANFIAFWVPSVTSCAPVYSVTINTAGGIGCEFDGAINIAYSECGPSQVRSLTISAPVRSVQLAAGLGGFPSGSTAIICGQNSPDVVTICSGGIWYSGAGDQVGGNSTNIAIDVTSGGFLFANGLSTNYGSNEGMVVQNGGVAESCNSTFQGQGTSATGMSVAGGGIYRSLCGNNGFFGTAGGNGIQIQASTAQVILNPLDGWTISNQASPTIGGTIFGTSPTIGTCSSGFNTAESGCALVTEGTTPPSSGTVILNFNQTYQYQALPVCTLAFRNGTGSWNARVSAITTTQSTTAYVWTVDNNAVALTAASTYGVIWNCVAR